MFNPKHIHQHVLMNAVHHDSLDIVERYLPQVHKTWCPEEILCYACQKGRLPIVQVLLKVSDPNYDLGRPLQQAIGGGNPEVVKCLLPHCNATLLRSEALQMCVLNGEATLFELVYPHSDCAVALSEINRSIQSLRIDSSDCLELRDRLTEIVAQQRQHKILNDATQKTGLPSAPRKI